MTEKFANNPTTTLNGAINNSVTSIVVHDVTSFPTSGNFRILIDSEIITVTAVNVGTNTFTVVRGTEGTTAVTHADAASVDGILTAGAIAALSTDITNNTLGYYGYNPDKAPPSPSAFDDEFNATTLSGAWTVFAAPVTQSLVTYPSYLFLADNSTSEIGVYEAYTPGASALTVVAKLCYSITEANFSYVGVVLKDGSGSNLAVMTLQIASGIIRLRTGFDGSVNVTLTNQIPVATTGKLYLMIQRDASTNYLMCVSTDGFNFWPAAAFSQAGTVGRLYLVASSVAAITIRVQFDFVRTFASKTFLIGA